MFTFSCFTQYENKKNQNEIIMNLSIFMISFLCNRFRPVETVSLLLNLHTELTWEFLSVFLCNIYTNGDSNEHKNLFIN